MRIRDKYGIPKGYEETFRPMEKLPDSAPGKSMQADFGEYWMHRDDTRRVKVYFFAAVMSYSRHKFTYFSKTPFTSELAIYAHQLAFRFYGGKYEYGALGFHHVLRGQSGGCAALERYGALRSTGLLTGYIVPCYDVLHTFSKEYIVEDLTDALREKGALA